MGKTLKELSLEYYKAAEDMDSLIKKCTKELNEAHRSRDMKKCYFLKQKRLVFYSQKRDLITTAYKLQNYYVRGDKRYESQ